MLDTMKGALIVAEVGAGIGSLCLLKQKDIKSGLFFASLAVVSELVRRSLSFTHRDYNLLNAFYNASKIIISKNVRFSNGEIPNYFFKNCDKASEIVIDGPFVCKKFPQNVEKIIYFGSLEDWNFENCPRLTTITDSDHPNRSGVYLQGLKTIPCGAFNGCRNVQSVHGPDVTLIQDYAFSDCSSLKEIKFPNVVTIEKSAFRNCENLTNIEASNVKNIYRDAFFNCSSLKKIEFPKLTTVDMDAFRDCKALTHVNCPEVTVIRSCAFYGCSSLTEVNFPNATTIGADKCGAAFEKCKSLIFINIPKVKVIIFYITTL